MRAGFDRQTAVAQLRLRLERLASPRLQMSLIVLVTGLAGWLASALMLGRGGIDSMALRYPLAVGCAYLVYLLLLWAWLRLDARDVGDMLDVTAQVPGGGPRGGCTPAGGGGDFGGGGATASFSSPEPGPVDALTDAVGRTAGASLEAEEGAIPLLALLIVVAMALGLFATSIYLVQLAPTLFAELLLDGALSYSLYRRLGRRDRPIDGPHWLSTALRRTALPFALTAVLMALIGAGLGWIAPEARHLGEVLTHGPASP